MPDILLARQPIFNGYLNLVGYELLYRDKNEFFPANVDANYASVTVILNALSQIGLPKLSGDYPVFINFTRQLILSAPWSILPRDKVVIEVLENIVVDNAILDVLKKAKHFGYQIALDDFVFNESLRPLLDLANVVKLDVKALSPEELTQQLDILQGYNVELLAEKVESFEMFDKCKQLGFDFYQGFFLSEPNIITQQSLKPAQKEVLEIIGKLHSPNPELQKIDDLLTKEEMLRDKLFKVINSQFYNLKQPLKTLQQAANTIGIEQVRNWVDIIMLCLTGNKTPEFFSIVLQRAEMCKTLATKMNLDGEETFFTVGLFSAMNALLDIPFSSVLSSVQIQPNIKEALIEHNGEAGKILDLVLAYEKGDWSHVNLEPLTDADLMQAYIQSIEWSRNIISILGYQKMKII